MASVTQEKTKYTVSDADLKVALVESGAPLVLALAECDAELRDEALKLFKHLYKGNLDAEDRFATIALISEILFPNSNTDGFAGLDLEQAEEIARGEKPEVNQILDQKNDQEAAFAVRLRDVMVSKNVTQEQLAERIGVGQPAISMMLQRNCRPQKRTVVRIAEALGISPDDLWPGIAAD